MFSFLKQNFDLASLDVLEGWLGWLAGWAAGLAGVCVCVCVCVFFLSSPHYQNKLQNFRFFFHTNVIFFISFFYPTCDFIFIFVLRSFARLFVYYSRTPIGRCEFESFSMNPRSEVQIPKK